MSEDDAPDVAEMLPEPIRLSEFGEFLKQKGALRNGCPVCGSKAFSTTVRRLGSDEMGAVQVGADLQTESGEPLATQIEFVTSTCLGCAATQFFNAEVVRAKMRAENV